MRENELDNYQDLINIMVEDNNVYPYYGTIDSIVEEVGEISRVLRPFHSNQITMEEREEISTDESLLGELGDAIFNIVLLASKHGISISDIIAFNQDKILKRKPEYILALKNRNVVKDDFANFVDQLAAKELDGFTPFSKTDYYWIAGLISRRLIPKEDI